MAHTNKNREKLLARLKKVRGQLNAVEGALAEEQDCSHVLMTLASCRGGLNSLMMEIVEDHIRFHIVNPEDRPASSKQAQATSELIDVLRTYLR